MYGCSMHQPVEWDFGGMDFQTPHNANDSGMLPGQQHQRHSQGIISTQAMNRFHHGFGGSWQSLHQPEFDTSALRPKQTVPHPQQPLVQSSSQALLSATTAPSSAVQLSREPLKRERSVRRAKSSTLRPQQQQMLELQKKLDTLLQEHSVVEAENQRLKTRLRVLEAVLPVREQQARWAQSKPLKTAPECPDPKLASLLEIATSGPSSCATSPPRLEANAAATCLGLAARMATDEEFGVAGGNNTNTNAINRLSQQQHMNDALVASSPSQAPAPGDAGPCASSSSCNPSGESRPVAVEGAAARGCCATGPAAAAVGLASRSSADPHPHPHSESEARWLDAWRAWVREAALLLQAHDARPNDHYVKRLEEAFTKLKSEVVYLGLKHPELICNMRCINLETGAEQEVPPDSFWTLVAAGMRLTPQQVANCKSALALYRERMAVVLAERRGLAAQLSPCLGALQLEEAGGRAAPGSLRREQLMLEAEEVTAALDANVAAEGHTTLLARDLLGSNLFSRVQCARGSVLSYPYFPDALAIITAAVAEAERGETAASPAGPPLPAGQSILLAAQS